jgi:lipopolysaccharide transport system ATP-binding protein
MSLLRLPAVALAAALALSAALPAGAATVDTFDPGFVSQSAITYGDGAAAIDEPWICAPDGRVVNQLALGGRYWYCYRVSFRRQATRVRFGMMFKTIAGVELGGAVSAAAGSPASLSVAAGDEFDVAFDFGCRLLAGTYFLNCGVVGVTDGEETYLHRVVDAVAFRVLPEAGETSTGTVDMGCRATIVARRPEAPR